MSLHRNDFLVSAHQAEMHRHAAHQRLVKASKRSSSEATRPGFAERTLTSLVAAIRPVRRAATDAVADAVKPALKPSHARG